MLEMRVTEIVLQWAHILGIQVATGIGNESDGYRLTVGDTREIQVGIYIGNQ